MGPLMEIQGMAVMGVLVVFLLAGAAFALIQLRRASSSRGPWAALCYRPVAGGTRTGMARQTSHSVRNYRGFEVHYLTHYKVGFGKTQMAVSWVCPLASPARFGLQVVEAGLADASPSARVSRTLSPYKYDWQARYAERIQIGDQELDARFAFVCNDQAAARGLLASPDLRPVLLSLRHVDLTLSKGDVRFEDPFNVNLWGLSGDALAEAHNRIADVLTQVAAAARAA